MNTTKAAKEATDCPVGGDWDVYAGIHSASREPFSTGTRAKTQDAVIRVTRFDYWLPVEPGLEEML